MGPPFGMDIGNSDNITRPSIPFHSYRIPSLTDAILDSNEIANLKDQYVLGEQLGWGQFGIIRACSDKLTGEVLACKSIAKDRLVTLNDVLSVKLEIEIMSRLSGHPNVVNLKAVYEEDAYVHLLMELCAGGELFHLLEKHGKFSEHNARVIFRHLMQVVQYCHDSGIVHRDLKPENILLATKSLSSPIKLADFGLATYIKPGEDSTLIVPYAPVTDTSFFLDFPCKLMVFALAGHSLHGTVGSPFYIAPEVLAGGYNQAADVWSAGVILYILLSGMPPFWGETKSRIFDAVRVAELRFPPDFWDDISASAKNLITGMLCKDPSKRLNASQVLAHSWALDCAQLAQESYPQDSLYCGQLEIAGGSFSTPSIARDQACSFTYESPVTGEDQQRQSHTLTSSFSSFLVNDNTLCSASGGFSLRNHDESGGIELPSPVSSILSFTFSPRIAVERDFLFDTEGTDSKLDAIHKEVFLGKLPALSDNFVPVNRGIGEMTQKIGIRQEGFNGSKLSSIHSRRNHTIGLGELGQFNIMVTESVIRWASCTHIPTAPSLGLSLVC
ncbi:hypothetical protein SADUNF_Sadunf01G0087900 [Salix dunnii]|uniref:Protein kinase domain-containing protein n=1 Tax=Salix dunnii TaxID=1413687 RepID=A0A835NAJ9_9ROSI|nr:hypothetical protein SADUNF_Sadunf01G0087900 [Salix dunnii]